MSDEANPSIMSHLSLGTNDFARSHSEERAHEEPVIEGGVVDEMTLADVHFAAEANAAVLSGFADVREGPFDELASSSLQRGGATVSRPAPVLRARSRVEYARDHDAPDLSVPS